MDPKDWYKQMRYELGEFAAFDSVCELAQSACTSSELKMAHRAARKLPDVDARDILGLMVLIGWKLEE